MQNRGKLTSKFTCTAAIVHQQKFRIVLAIWTKFNQTIHLHFFQNVSLSPQWNTDN